ncbi:MAG: formamidopyrimidine-DNA glycosylase [Planctomycetes bacterium]|nr:formamidopyrimidine-DNA glycosylase [Planctomycetota bacterium]
MPELPDITIYTEALTRLIVGERLLKIDLRSPFLVRTFDPEITAVEGKRVLEISRLGKRIVWHLEDDLFLIFHLMIAGRFHCRKPNSRPSGKRDLCGFQFEQVTLMLTEANSKQRAGLWCIRGRDQLAEHDPGGIDPLTCSPEEFRTALQLENRTLKRALSNPKTFSGIGNAYSDEILHAAQLSPLLLSGKLSEDEIAQLYEATQQTLTEWTDRLREKTGDKFPEQVTAFHSEMAVHGKFGEPCPVCGQRVARIVYADRETNYCPHCQTGGKVLKDRALSRLLKDDWPSTVEEWE